MSADGNNAPAGRGSSSDDYTRDFTDVHAAERAVVQARRTRRGEAPDARNWALALSSGGIRSAAFALGVLQALDARGVYRKLDYVSSASGGSYTAAALAWLTRGPDARFPFEAAGKEARYMRDHADYLNPRSDGISFLSLIGQLVTQSAISLLVYASLLIGAFFLFEIADAIFDLFKPALHTASRSDWWYAAVERSNAAIALALSCMAIAIGWRLFARISHWFGRSIVHRPAVDVAVAYRKGLRRQRALGRLIATAGAALVVGSVPPVVQALATIVADEVLRGLLLSLLLVLALAFALHAFGPTRPYHERLPSGSRDHRMPTVAAALTLYTLLLASHGIAWIITDSGAVGSIFGIVGLGVIAGFALNLNALGPVRIYRDRLIEAFMPDAESIELERWQPASRAAAFELSALADAGGDAPFPLINCNLIAPRSQIASCRERGGDSFVLSPLYSGSAATGWRRTASWPRRRPLTLGTAMAISGAALTPDAADVGRGVTRARLVSAAMALFNLRLCYWLENPDPRIGRRTRRFPSLLSPGLRQSALGLGLAETEPWLQLSDGGHFDALGLYELVRRELDVIIVSDATAGEGFESLGSVTQRVRSDFGADIKLDLGDDLAKHGFAAGSIRYRDGREATLIYLRATLVPELPIDVRAYADDHPSFPHEATSDYSFGEAEFEAYRMLGHGIARGSIAQHLPHEEPADAPRESMWRALRGAKPEDQASGQ